MEAIFHEKQEGSLCAQHCLNALLQGPYFTPVDLASLAQRMDDEERLRMSESGVDSDEYRRFLEQPSGNYDDSGYFSVQVISSALEVWGLELVPYNSTEPRALEAQSCPSEMQAFICNYRDHWFTIRRLGHQWFNLNSLLTGPELISDTYLAMFLAQLQQEGYSIFVVFGELPESEADNLLKLVPAVQTVKPRLLTAVVRKVVPANARSSVDEDVQPSISLSLGSGTSGVERIIPIDLEPRLQGDDGDLQAAISLSLQDPHSEPAQPLKIDDEELQLQRALRMSIGTDQNTMSSILPRTISQDEDLQLQQALRLSLQPEVQCEEEDEARDLERALQLSLECSDSNNQVDLEEVRRRRLAYLEGAEDRNNQLSPASVKNEVNS